MNAQKPGKKGFAVASLVLGFLGLPTAGLVGIGAMLGIVLGVVGLVKARNEPETYGGKGLAVAGIALSIVSLVMAPVLGIIAAIAIPSLLRARVSANESAVIGELRSVLVAETSYRSINGGHYDTLECLAKPSGCVPGYSGTALLDAEVAKAGARNGYHRVFYAGSRPEAEVAAATPVSPSSVTGFAYVAVPIQPGKTGVRSFCVDAGGEILVQSDGTAPAIVGGACPEDWDALR